MRTWRWRGAVAGVAVAAALIGPASAQADGWPTFVNGSPGLGDPFFPLAGNGGYDVRHYDLDLDYTPGEANLLIGKATIVATATDNLRRFNLDFRGYDIASLRVNGLRASFARDGQELAVTPRLPLFKRRPFVVTVRYEGNPAAVIDPDGSSEGWIPTADGAFVVNEPQGSPGWYPANDNPRDKATYSFAITVPEGKTALGNGVLLSRRTRGGKTTWRWLERYPMAPYLATATNGDFDFNAYRTDSGLPVYTAVDPTLEQPAGTELAKIPEIIDVFSEVYGRYPFEAAGGIVDNAPDVGYALETQTKANYDSDPDLSTVVHEISHEWWGNAVTLTVWPDIWLNEGFARYSEWLYDERTDVQPASQSFRDSYARYTRWSPAPAALPSAAVLFSSPPYERGAMTLQALRETIGDEDFFALLRTWYRENRYGNVTTPQFIATAERVSGEQLDAFFEQWLYTPAQPPLPAG